MRLSRFGGLRSSLFRLSLICTVVLTVATATAQDDLSSEPFSVFVAQEKTFARCGPSDEYYRTDALRHGQQLQVYLETDDGWLGVRPPESSFCWVPASAVEIEKGGETATISEDRTVSWIGTHLGRARKYRWQVQLAEGEQLTILGRSERDGPDGPQTWLRIVPPSGEFRWVHRDQVVESAEELVASVRNQAKPPSEQNVDLPTRPLQQPAAQSTGNRQDSIARTSAEGPDLVDTTKSSRRKPQGNPNRKPTLALSEEKPQLRAAPEPQQESAAQEVVGSGLSEQWNADETRNPLNQAAENTTPGVNSQPEQTIADASVAASTEFIGRPRLLEIGAGASAPQNNLAAAESNWVLGTGRLGQPSTISGGVQQTSYQEQVSNQGSQSRTVPAANVDQIAREVLDADVDKLQLLLSRLMANGASAAEVEPIVRRARSLSMTAVDQVTTGRARLVAERAQQYQNIARRRDGNTVIRDHSVPVIPAGHTTTSAAANPAAAATAPRGDTQTGYLVQVYSARSNSPPFALTDHAGNTIAYVTPQPGINLRGHLNSHIKVIGNRGFLRGLNMPHFLVSQAVRTPENR